MCDYSLQNVKSRPAKVSDKLTTNNFGTGTRGFAASEDSKVAVCVLPGTEIGFDDEIRQIDPASFGFTAKSVGHKVAIFRQINKDKAIAHHDALELPDGTVITLNQLIEGQVATVLQLPAAPKTEQEVEDQRRVEFAG